MLSSALKDESIDQLSVVNGAADLFHYFYILQVNICGGEWVDNP